MDILTPHAWETHVSPCSCVAPGWKKRRMIMGAVWDPCQVVLLCVLRLAGAEETFRLKLFQLLGFSSLAWSVAWATFERAEMMQWSHGPAPFPQESPSGARSPRWKCHFPVLNSASIKSTMKDLTELFWWSLTKCMDLFHSPWILLEWCKSQFCTGLAIKEHYESIWYYVLIIALHRLLTYVLQLSL